LVDHAQRIIPFEDTDVSDFVTNSLIENGVRIIHSAKVRDVIRKSDHLEVILDFLDGRSEVIEADVTLVSIGRNIELSHSTCMLLGLS
jgi:dihydrolipoamide dehydrogenase